jgi:hypothetical protein
MGISLNGLTPAGTYPGLIKTGDNTAISGTPKVLSDGNGNNLPMEVSTTGVNFTNNLTQGGVAVPTASQVAAKQDTLVSGTNIKTINGTSLLGSGNIPVVTSPSGVSGAIQFSNGSAFASDAANLFWDDTNNRLGVGLNNPTQTADILGNVKIASATSGLLIRDFTAFNTFKAFYKASETPSDSNYLIALDTDVLINSRGSGTDISYNNSLRARFGNATSLLLKGSGSTSATTSLLVQNSAGTTSLQVRDNGELYLNALGYYQYRVADFITSRTLSASNAFLFFTTDYGLIIDANASVGCGTSGNNLASAKLQVDSTTRGFLPPRMTTTQKNAIASPAAGLVVYDSTTNKLQCYNGSTWNDLF